MKMVSITEKGFNAKRERGELFAAETGYKLTGRYGVQFGYSPDGEGFYWFDTKEELVKEFG
jgi:hypothetical protein